MSIGQSAYAKGLLDFLKDSDADILDALRGSGVGQGEHFGAQVRAWDRSLPVLKAAIREVAAIHPLWSVVLEYELPRSFLRPDCILIAGPIVIVIELKTSSQGAAQAFQAYSYAAHLVHFHGGSHDKVVVPLACVVDDAGFEERRCLGPPLQCGAVPEVYEVNAKGLGAAILTTYAHYAPAAGSVAVDRQRWLGASFKRSNDIITATVNFVQGHSVDDLAHSHLAGLVLRRGASVIQQIIRDVFAAGAVGDLPARKVICFVTGIPGAGKTLLGLHVATGAIRARLGLAGAPNETDAVFLSGNTPLIAVLRETLNKELKRGNGSRGGKRRKKPAEAEAEPIQGVPEALTDMHEWIRRGAPSGAPAERVVVFDEAQRVWSEKERKKPSRGTRDDPFERWLKTQVEAGTADLSEAGLTLMTMGRHERAVIVALIGEGQEINRGEVGLHGWGSSLLRSPDWTIVGHSELMPNETRDSPLLDSETVAGSSAGELDAFRRRFSARDELRLTVSQRAIVAPRHPEWVDLVLACRDKEALELRQRPDAGALEVAITQDMGQCRQWLRQRIFAGDARVATGGLIASSNARRLIAHGLPVQRLEEERIAHWFLRSPAEAGAGPDERQEIDPRCGEALEVILTEYAIQGLERDYIGLLWDVDLSPLATGDWLYQEMSGEDWNAVHNTTNRKYIENTFRVLLTRARRGMIIFVPREDPLKPSQTDNYEAIYDYLCRCGATPL